MPEHHPDREDFGSFYAGSRKWSGNPNAALVREAGPLNPGTALDVGYGEGADVVWLAEHGWRTTGIDPVDTTLGRARALADARGVAVELRRAGVGEFVPGQPFDLVACSYLPVGPEAVAAVEQLVAPGGTLLWVHHDFGPQGRSGIISPAQVAQLLGTEFTVHTLETVNRGITHGAGAHHTRDVVLVAGRTG
ncbi:class I SAM-dependent methyltransferase [Corynebacterium halotolerans]|uniref:Methyltransferase domain-containing protein n=1 Tax=Corynebacterium halotolerans YIM 70093 = DSM 44683 TaxID=1121362 RepID=M1P6M5_9CORY|nr:class I SAM-dependent methyltransferase [Corynebacterium halotolerans]AGF72316.1 hypothetical protein A605_06570 [Corynebacterium halotolerans YIM 70093 = DSM 44683]